MKQLECTESAEALWRNGRSPLAVEMKKIDRYEIITRLGSGGCGAVYSAYDPVMRRNVAIKVLLPVDDRAMLERFHREARVNLRHENIVTMHDFGYLDDQLFQPYLVMELL